MGKKLGGKVSAVELKVAVACVPLTLRKARAEVLRAAMLRSVAYDESCIEQSRRVEYIGVEVEDGRDETSMRSDRAADLVG